jgi:MATE family multidrug resistance protein
MGQPEELSLLSGSYARTAVWVFFPGLAFIVLRILLAAHNDTSIILVITVIGIAVNAVCNYALMFGNWGFPRLELAGAGIATVLVNTLMFLLALLYAVTRPQIRPYQLFLRFWKPDWPRFAGILRLGMPIGLLMTAEVGLFAVGAIFMGWLGADELAGHAVAMQYAGIAFMVPMGLSQASTVRVGIAHGRRDAEAVRKAGWVSIALGTGFMALTGTIFWLAPEPLVGLFLDPALPQNQVPFALAVAYLGVAALFQLADGAQVVSAAVLRGLSDTTVPMIVGIFGYSGIGLSTAYLCAFVYDLRGVGIWYGLAGGLTVVALILCTRFALRDRLGLMR